LIDHQQSSIVTCFLTQSAKVRAFGTEMTSTKGIKGIGIGVETVEFGWVGFVVPEDVNTSEGGRRGKSDISTGCRYQLLSLYMTDWEVGMTEEG
jgi:hypothetical protein